MQITSDKMLKLGLIDGIIKEPMGGAHNDPQKAYKNLKAELKKDLKELVPMDAEERITKRIEKFANMGVVVYSNEESANL
jgi:acetyl-CoA carboxylase carboxyl transferase subunit alpha